MQNDWAYNELYRARLWDKRCVHTLVAAVQLLADNAQASLSQVLAGKRKAISHILHRKETTAEDLLLGHIRATATRCKQEDLVLIASDTTTMDFTTHFALEGVGPISDKKYQRGPFPPSPAESVSQADEGKRWARVWARMCPPSQLRRRSLLIAITYAWPRF